MLITLPRLIYRDWSAIHTPIKIMGWVLAIKYLGIGLIDPFYTLFLKSLTDSFTRVGAWVSLLGLVSLITLLPLIRLADHIKNKLVVWHGYQAYIAAMVFYFLAGIERSTVWLFFAVLLHGMGITMVDASAEAYVRRHSTFHHTARTFGYLNSVKYLGWVLGIVAAGFLFPRYGISKMFLVAMTIFILGAFLLHWIPERGLSSMFSGFHRYCSRLGDWARIADDIHLLGFRMVFNYGLAFFDGMVSILMFSFIPLFANSLLLSYREITFLMGAMYLPFLLSFFFAELADRFRKVDLILLGLVLAAGSFLLLSFITAIHWIVAMSMMISLGIALIRPAYNGLVSGMTPKGMLGEVSNIEHFVLRSAITVCPILFGMIADALTLRYVFFFSALLSLFMIGLAFMMKGVIFFEKGPTLKGLIGKVI